MSEDSLLKYGESFPNVEAGFLRPWKGDELVTRNTTVTLICDKIIHNPHKNKALKEGAKILMSFIEKGDLPGRDSFNIEQTKIDRLFPAKWQ